MYVAYVETKISSFESRTASAAANDDFLRLLLPHGGIEQIDYRRGRVGEKKERAKRREPGSKIIFVSFQ
jgi:hypothetical protein